MKSRSNRWLAALLGSFIVMGAMVGCNSGSSDSSSTPTATPTPTAAPTPTPAPTISSSIKHVFVITLENENYTTTFGASSPATYLSQTLPTQGALLTQYFGTGHVSLDNYIAMISGQAGNPDTNTDCQTYSDFAQTGTDADGQAIGHGCVYPATVKTLPDQLKAANLTWHGYMEDMGNDPSRESATCGHPVIGTQDMTQSPEASSVAVANGDQYATRHNPFAYFHSIIDSSDCAANVVELAHLQTDLQSISTTSNFNFITPNLCHDGHDGGGGSSGTCVTGETGGLVSADAFLKKWVPIIMASPAFKQDGLLIINFDESSAATSTTVMTSATTGTLTAIYTGATCCGQKPGPNLASYPQTQALGSYLTHGITFQVNITYNSFGGDNTGAVLLSPFIKGGTVTSTGYNHYSMLRTIEDIFQLGHLGYAGQTGLASFGSDIFTNLH
ncbi:MULTISPECIES: alkaline phosphatase family protein [Silvimonas]|uniref:alkaline phosphatase family protein n=1 Tax=Silvimonas TaxID=300264 RepID=UPI0024B36592|nr:MULTISPECIES: alkaline phosphatase family protein [Silvimonas]MDR3430229.1 alkaline phosphatase family protein [Silvimonas sp.]